MRTSRPVAILLAWLLAFGLGLSVPTSAAAEDVEEPSSPSVTVDPTPEPKPEPEAEPKSEPKPEPAIDKVEPPSIVKQPEVEITTQVGSEVTLKVEVAHADEYQWQVLETARAERGEDVEQATEASFDPDTDTAGVFHYRLRASNPAGYTDSDVVTLTVIEPAATPTGAVETVDPGPAEPEETADDTDPAADPGPAERERAAGDAEPAQATGPGPEAGTGAVSSEEPVATDESVVDQAEDGTSQSRGFLALSPFALDLSATAESDSAEVYTHFDGETVSYPIQVVPGEPIRVSGTGWLTKPGHPGVDEGDEGSVIGFKFMPASGSVIRQVRVPNPRTGEADYASPDVWDIAQAAGTGDWWNGATPGSWSIDIPWPTADLASNPPTLAAGDTFTLQLLSGTLYSNEVGNADQRPDVSRTIALTLTVAGATDPEPGEPTDPEEPTEPSRVTTHPASQTVEAGGSVTFRAAAEGGPAVQWQRSDDGGQTWTDLRGARTTSHTVDPVALTDSGQQYRAVFTAADWTEATNPATLSVTPRGALGTTCGNSYGPGAANSGIPFCFRGPEKVVAGQPIVIEGLHGYLATDDATGSVVNFFLDAEYSGDPNTVYSKKLFINPATGATISDRRTNAIVQANSDGAWRVEIPWPTVDTISPTSDGQASYTQQQLDEKFAPGTTHSFRMLTGSLMNNPSDRQRGGSLYFTVVESLDDETGVAEPPYEHQAFESGVTGDRAVAWVQQQVSSGQSIGLTGTDWLTKDRQWGSTVAVRLQESTGAYHRHAGTAADPHADPADPTVWQLVKVRESGNLNTRIPMPAAAEAGDFLAVELTTADDGTPLGDVARHWVSEPLVIDNVPYVAPPGENATCTAPPGAASYELAPGMKVPAANVGGTIRLVGRDWCNLVGGGSLIAIKIDDGAYSRLTAQTAPMFDANLDREVGECPAEICVSNKTIWYVIEADDGGSFDVNIPLPERSNSSPRFGEGSYTLRIMTRTLSADPYYQGKRPDPSRTMKSPEFTVIAEGESLEDVTPGRPGAAPDPLHTADDLTEAARGGVTVDQQAKRWLVTVPSAAPGDWVYVNVYDGQSPRFPWGTRWFQVDASHRVSLPLSGVMLPSGTNKLSVQDRAAGLLGWTSLTVADATETTTVTTPIRFTSISSQVGQAKPSTTPDRPVASYAELDESSLGKVTATESGGKLRVTVPGVAGGHWVYLYLYTETGTVAGIDWVQVGTDHSFTVDTGKLPDGSHKLAILGADGRLLGWVSAPGPAPLSANPEVEQPGGTTAGESSPHGGSPRPADAVPVAADGDDNLTLILVSLAFLVLAGSAAGVIALRTPVHPGATSKGRP
ncbi:MAG: immunoglobulin domain-containing protein [Propionicimonas sp.]